LKTIGKTKGHWKIVQITDRHDKKNERPAADRASKLIAIAVVT